MVRVGGHAVAVVSLREQLLDLASDDSKLPLGEEDGARLLDRDRSTSSYSTSARRRAERHGRPLPHALLNLTSGIFRGLPGGTGSGRQASDRPVVAAVASRPARRPVDDHVALARLNTACHVPARLVVRMLYVSKKLRGGSSRPHRPLGLPHHPYPARESACPPTRSRTRADRASFRRAGRRALAGAAAYQPADRPPPAQRPAHAQPADALAAARARGREQVGGLRLQAGPPSSRPS